jgi:hypothetical protein
VGPPDRRRKCLGPVSRNGQRGLVYGSLITSKVGRIRVPPAAPCLQGSSSPRRCS